MGRPGFVLDSDDRTPPLVVENGDGFRMERFPPGTQVIYPAESLPAVPDLAEAVGEALDSPHGSEPLAQRLRPAMRLTIAFDDISVPIPRMRRPDIRGTIIEAVLVRAAAAGVDDVAVVAATGLNRRMTPAELQYVLGERVFRSFFADGLLTNHDAEDHDRLTTVGPAETGEVELNSRAATADLLVYVHLVGGEIGSAPGTIARGLGSTATISRLQGLTSGGPVTAAAISGQLEAAVPIFQVDAVLDNDVFTSPVEFLAKREWEWGIRDQLAWTGVRQGLAMARPRARRRIFNRAVADFGVTAVFAGSPAAVRAASAPQLQAQQVVEVQGQADVGVIGVGATSPYSVDSVTNPILAAWTGLAATFGSHTGRPFVREGGALILYHPLPADFSPLHHPSYVDFFAEILTETSDPAEIEASAQDRFVKDPWYVHLYRTSLAYHGVHPLHRWYETAAARQHCSDIVWVGADRTSAARLGFRAASTLADALEIVSSTVGRSPTIRYLHAPPPVVVDVR
jgi:hypothetical protein